MQVTVLKLVGPHLPARLLILVVAQRTGHELPIFGKAVEEGLPTKML